MVVWLAQKLVHGPGGLVWGNIGLPFCRTCFVWGVMRGRRKGRLAAVGMAESAQKPLEQKSII